MHNIKVVQWHASYLPGGGGYSLYSSILGEFIDYLGVRIGNPVFFLGYMYLFRFSNELP